MRCRIRRHINQYNHFRELFVSIVTKHTVSKYSCPQKTLRRMFTAVSVTAAQRGGNPNAQQQNDCIGTAKEFAPLFPCHLTESRMNFLPTQIYTHT